jgi:hypothetical protein
LLSPLNLFVAGVFDKMHCLDVGVDHGGWGEAIAEVKLERTQE